MKEIATAAGVAQRQWEEAGLEARLRVLQAAGSALATRRAELIDGLRADGLSTQLAEYYGDWIVHQGDPDLLAAYARDMLRRVDTGDGPELYLRRADGVVLLVTPANSPTINAATLFSILLPGNAVVVRAPANDGGLRFITEKIVRHEIERAGFSGDVVSAVTGKSRAVLGELMPHPALRTVVFFGNSTAGRSVAENAHKHNKKVVLELEGSDHMVVWKDADIAGAVSSAKHAFDFSTQPCPIPKHMLVHEDVYDQFVEGLLAEVPACSITVEADPEDGNLVPLARPQAFVDAFEEAVPLSKILCGGFRMNAHGEKDPEGTYVAPTVVGFDAETVLSTPLRCFDEEIFFPLIPVVKFTGSDEAIAKDMGTLLRRSEFGLRCSVWTETPEAVSHFTRCARDVGLIIFNDEHSQVPAYASPWGGPGRSGGAHGESHLFWEKTSHLQAISCRKMTREGIDAVLSAFGYPVGGTGASVITGAGIARVTLERPHRHNSVDASMKDALGSITERLHRQSGDLRVTVISGAGKSFCSGADVRALGNLDVEGARRFMIEATWAFRRIEALPTPVIAAVRGYCLGGGLELALHCDEIIAADDAVFGFPETGLGLTTTAGSVARLEAAVGVMRARELLLGGRRFDAQAALEMGLVTQVVPAAELDAVVQARCEHYQKMPGEGVAAMKKVLREGQRSRDSWIPEIEAFSDIASASGLH